MRKGFGMILLFLLFLGISLSACSPSPKPAPDNDIPPCALQVGMDVGTTKDKPIGVNQANIQAFHSYANTPACLGLHYQLEEDIELVVPTTPSTSNWRAIGTHDAPFTGSFNGNNHTISGLTIYAAAPDDFNQGLFGLISAGAIIENLRLFNSRVYGSVSVGAVVGYSKGTVQNCYVTAHTSSGTVCVGGVVGSNDGTVRNCHVAGELRGVSYVGGVVGNNDGTVQNCHASGSVTGTSADRKAVGGVVGASYGTVQNCYATCDVSGGSNVGGVVGEQTGSLHNSYAKGKVHGSGKHVGGVVGLNDSRGIVQSSYATGNVSGNNTVGGVVGLSWGKVRSCYATGTVSATNSTAGGVVGGSVQDATQHCVALNPSVSIGSNSPNVGRVAGLNTGVHNNYANASMQLYADGALVPLEASDTGLYTIHGENVTLDSVSTQSWWTTSSHWPTDSGEKAWDFEEVWEWGSGHLPILRNAGGVQ